MVDIFNVTIPQLTGEEERAAYIYVPEGEPGKRYPVLYMFDGHNLFLNEDATYGKSWGLKEYLQGWNKEMIIVGIECGHEGNERLSEYLPYECSHGWLRGTAALGEKTMQGIVYELKPYIDARFPTMPFRECTGIAGSSMGGIMAAYALVHYNQIFSKAACLSPALGGTVQKLWKEMNENPVSADTRIYLSWGTLEGKISDHPEREDRSSWMYKSCKATATKVEKAGGAARCYCQIGGHHCEADWEKQIPIFMPFLWQS